MTGQTFVVPAHERAMRAEVISPRASVFLRANAGSGKTTILTNRVIRLLLDGVDPARILCVTYTKAAAAEMQNRIFDRLGRWVRLPDGALDTDIADLTGERPGPALRARARQLFAEAVETPGGLKLQTIHAFAERLLHLFPCEANVPARFTVMDDLTRGELIEAAKKATLAAALAAPLSATGLAFHQLAGRDGEDVLDRLIGASQRLYAEARIKGLEADERRRLIASVLGISPNDSFAAIEAEYLALPLGPACWPALADALDHSEKKTDREKAPALRIALTSGNARQQMILLKKLFLTDKEDKLREAPLTVVFLRNHPQYGSAVTATAAAIPALLERERALLTLERSDALMVLLDDIHQRYKAAKDAAALVDFDDIILRTQQLVQDEGAAWVMRKLDGGIDHVLVDEAQDTTPPMWSILAALTQEFFAGAGARPGGRTVFAVGDEKQSIYSFQGAKPKAFADHRRHFARRAAEAGAPFLDRELKLSFRTVDDVLRAVDRLFADAGHRRGLSADDSAPVHETARVGSPGMVDLWPIAVQEPKKQREAWEEVDAVGRQSAQIALANRIADHIAHQIETGRHPSDGKRIRAGDIMVLIQSRDAFFSAMIRALKRRGVPVAGADRLRLTEEQAVLDLVCAARAALLPDDDLTVATALKSPLIGLTDDDLMAIAPSREGSLHAALGHSADPRHRAAHAELAAWQNLAATTTPYGFFATLLGPRGGRKRLLARLGADAEDGINLYLQSVLAREARQPPSLVSEVEAFQSLTAPVKRDQEHGGNVVRVMTVHGAKGLEARIVYLPDSTRLPNTKNEVPLYLRHAAEAPDLPVLINGGAKNRMPSRVVAMREDALTARQEEHRRLLYVAMTRARDHLILAGWSTKDEADPNSWYGMAEASLAGACEPMKVPGIPQDIRRYRTVSTPAAPPSEDGPTTIAPVSLPDWALRHPPPEMPVRPPIRPSRAIEAADVAPSSERDTARLTGDAMHMLLERMPAEATPDFLPLADRILAARWPRLPETERQRIAGEALALAQSPQARALFGADAQAEVDVTGEITLPDGRRRPVSGRIDRLVVMDERIVIADFKSGAAPQPGAMPPSHVLQLALYRRLLGAIYPDRAIEAMIVYTRAARIDLVPADLMDQALTLL